MDVFKKQGSEMKKGFESVPPVTRPKFSPEVRGLIEKLMKLTKPLDMEGQPSVSGIAAALLDISAELRASQKPGWERAGPKPLNLNDPVEVIHDARPLLVSLANRLNGLYTLYESLDEQKGASLVPLIEEVSKALSDVAGVLVKDDGKWSDVFERAGEIEHRAADRLT